MKIGMEKKRIFCISSMKIVLVKANLNFIRSVIDMAVA